jgi:hypothetical protein
MKSEIIYCEGGTFTGYALKINDVVIISITHDGMAYIPIDTLSSYVVCHSPCPESDMHPLIGQFARFRIHDKSVHGVIIGVSEIKNICTVLEYIDNESGRMVIDMALLSHMVTE